MKEQGIIALFGKIARFQIRKASWDTFFGKWKQIPTLVWPYLGHVTWKMIWASFDSIFSVGQGIFPQLFGSVMEG